jgi:hypothetical protein
MPKKIIAETFLDIANAIESGEFGKKHEMCLENNHIFTKDRNKPCWK